MVMAYQASTRAFAGAPPVGELTVHMRGAGVEEWHPKLLCGSAWHPGLAHSRHQGTMACGRFQACLLHLLASNAMCRGSPTSLFPHGAAAKLPGITEMTAEFLLSPLAPGGLEATPCPWV